MKNPPGNKPDISIESPKYKEVSRQRTASGVAVLIDLELEVKTYILPNHKDLVTLKNPPGNKPDISIESSKYEEAS